MTQPSDTEWKRGAYFDFWDVPRALVVHHGGRALFLDCPFDEALDDFPATYSVWELEPLDPESPGSLEDVERRKLRRLADIPVSALEFGPEREHDTQSRYWHVWYRFRSQPPESQRDGEAS
jgi:hypothetical protein